MGYHVHTFGCMLRKEPIVEDLLNKAKAALDANADGKVNSQDLRRTQRYILGLMDKL